MNECVYCGEEIDENVEIGTQDGNYHAHCRGSEISEICIALDKVWSNHPHLRLGQLLERFVFQAKDPFYFGDKETMSKLEELL